MCSSDLSETNQAAESAHEGRGRRKTVMGLVTGDKTDKTRRVEVVRLQKHPKYGKFLRRRQVCHVHDEKNESNPGDLVLIAETRPMSKNKNWRLKQIIERAK